MVTSLTPTLTACRQRVSIWGLQRHRVFLMELSVGGSELSRCGLDTGQCPLSHTVHIDCPLNKNSRH